MFLRLRLAVLVLRLPIVAIPIFIGNRSLLIRLLPIAKHVDQTFALRFDFPIDVLRSIQKRLNENQKTCQPLLAVDEFQLADLMSLPVVISLKADRAVVILGAFVVLPCLGVVAEAVEIVQ